jgi:hypothetical protein
VTVWDELAKLSQQLRQARQAELITESEWFASDDPKTLLRHLQFSDANVSERKLRLFACACCRRIWHLLNDHSRKIVEACEVVMDGEVSPFDPFGIWRLGSGETLAEHGDLPARAAQHVTWPFELSVSPKSAYQIAAEGSADDAAEATENAEQGSGDRERAVQASLLRDVVADPFRSAPLLPPGVRGWNDGAVLFLARSIYGERAFGQLPILADALEDAGCADDAILAHLRSAGPHVRGCWALDLILGKN